MAVIKMSRHTTKRLTEDRYKANIPADRETRNREAAIHYRFYGLLAYKHGTKRQEVQKYGKKAWTEYNTGNDLNFISCILEPHCTNAFTATLFIHKF
jgi:hypothetical protein